MGEGGGGRAVVEKKKTTSCQNFLFHHPLDPMNGRWWTFIQCCSESFHKLLFIYFHKFWQHFLRAILMVLQIPSAVHDPVMRYAALLSLICALMSLLYGNIIWWLVELQNGPNGRVLLIVTDLLHVFLGQSEDNNRHFLECLGISSDASNMACMISRSSLGMKS